MRIPFYATAFTFLCVCILCGLGVWQLQRLAWKNLLVAKIEAAYAPGHKPDFLSATDFSSKPLDFLRATVRGHYLSDQEILIGLRTHDGDPGYHVWTPFVVDGSGPEIRAPQVVVMVNRGWIPLAQNTPEAASARDISDEIILTGLIRVPFSDNIFVPQNKPQENRWYRVDLPMIAKARGLKNLQPYVLYVEEEAVSEASKKIENTLIRVDSARHFRNNHGQYALFWFSMAGVLIVIYGIRFFIFGVKNQPGK